MSSFTSDLIVKSFSDSQWEIYKEFDFYYDEEGGETVIIPVGFITDFATIPRLFWSVIAPTGRHTKAAVLHDYLYSNSSQLKLTRKKCDELFLKAMEVLGVLPIKRQAMYRAVRIFGGKYYKKRNNS